jgi:hypothetical protein
MVRRPARVRLIYPAASRSVAIVWTARSVIWQATPMSLIRALELRAISIRTCPWPVSSVQRPAPSAWSV